MHDPLAKVEQTCRNGTKPFSIILVKMPRSQRPERISDVQSKSGANISGKNCFLASLDTCTAKSRLWFIRMQNLASHTQSSGGEHKGRRSLRSPSEHHAWLRSPKSSSIQREPRAQSCFDSSTTVVECNKATSNLHYRAFQSFSAKRVGSPTAAFALLRFIMLHQHVAEPKCRS